MATIEEMRLALVSTVRAANPEMNAYAVVSDAIQVPAFIVGTPKADFAVTMNRGADEWEFELYVLVGVPELGIAQSNLDVYVSGSGPKSLREIIWNDPTLGGVVDDSIVMTMDSYGGRYSVANIPHVGACLKIKIFTVGT